MEPIPTPRATNPSMKPSDNYLAGSEGGTWCSEGEGSHPHIFPKYQQLPMRAFSLKVRGGHICHFGVEESAGDLEFFRQCKGPWAIHMCFRYRELHNELPQELVT